MATLTTDLNLGTLNEDGTYTDPSAAITTGTTLDADGIKNILNTRVYYDGNVTSAEATAGTTTQLNANSSVTGTDCTYITGTLQAGSSTSTIVGGGFNLDRSILMFTQTGGGSGTGGVVQYNTADGFNVTNSQIIFSNRAYGTTRIQYNIRNSTDLTNTTVLPAFRDTGAGAVEFVVRVDPDNATLTGLSLGEGVFFLPYAALPLPQVVLAAQFNTASVDGIRTVIDVDADQDVGYAPWWDCDFSAWATNTRVSLQSNATLGQQVNIWIVNGVWPDGGTATNLIVRGNSNGDGIARSLSAWRPLFSVQPNADARINFDSSPTAVFLKPTTTTTLGTTGIPVTHAEATSSIPDTSANNTNGYLIQSSAQVSPASNNNANLVRADISSDEVQIWDYTNNTPWMTEGLTETPTVNLNDGNAANGTFAEGTGQIINNAIDPLITEDTLATAAALATGSLDDFYQSMKARWVQNRNGLPFLTSSAGDEDTILAALDVSVAGVMDFGARNLIIRDSATTFNPSPTGGFFNVGIAGTPQLTAGTFFNTLQTTGRIEMDNTIGPGVSLVATTLTNLPTTLGADTSWTGTFTTTSATDVTYDMTGADISGLIFINNGTGTVRIAGAAEDDFGTAPSGTGTIIFPFVLTIDSGPATNDGLISIYFDDVLQTTAQTYTLEASTVVDVIYTEAGRTDYLSRTTVDRIATITVANSANLYPDTTNDTSGLFTLAAPTGGIMNITVNNNETSSGFVNDAFQEHVKATANYNLLVQQAQVADIVTSLGIESNAQLNSDHINLVSTSPITIGFVSSVGTGTLTSTTSVDASSLGLGTLEIGVTINDPAAFDPGITGGQINDAVNRISANVDEDHIATRELINDVNTNVTDARTDIGDEAEATRTRVTDEANATRFNTDLATGA